MKRRNVFKAIGLLLVAPKVLLSETITNKSVVSKGVRCEVFNGRYICGYDPATGEGCSFIDFLEAPCERYTFKPWNGFRYIEFEIPMKDLHAAFDKV